MMGSYKYSNSSVEYNWTQAQQAQQQWNIQITHQYGQWTPTTLTQPMFLTEIKTCLYCVFIKHLYIWTLRPSPCPNIQIYIIDIWQLHRPISQMYPITLVYQQIMINPPMGGVLLVFSFLSLIYSVLGKYHFRL